MLELADLEMKENCGIEELTLGEKKLLLLIKLVADTSEKYILQSLFQDMKEKRSSKRRKSNSRNVNLYECNSAQFILRRV